MRLCVYSGSEKKEMKRAKRKRDKLGLMMLKARCKVRLRRRINRTFFLNINHSLKSITHSQCQLYHKQELHLTRRTNPPLAPFLEVEEQVEVALLCRETEEAQV